MLIHMDILRMSWVKRFAFRAVLTVLPVLVRVNGVTLYPVVQNPVVIRAAQVGVAVIIIHIVGNIESVEKIVPI